jgi:hypothetical protein
MPDLYDRLSDRLYDLNAERSALEKDRERLHKAFPSDRPRTAIRGPGVISALPSFSSAAPSLDPAQNKTNPRRQKSSAAGTSPPR